MVEFSQQVNVWELAESFPDLRKVLGQTTNISIKENYTFITIPHNRINGNDTVSFHRTVGHFKKRNSGQFKFSQARESSRMAQVKESENFIN